MSETLTVTYERVDDIPLLMAQLERMGLQQLLDKHFPTHGNWQGLPLGWVVSIWLSHILSQGDHRLSYVQPWADQRLETLRSLTGQSVRALDLSDDRLEAVLRYLSEDEPWRGFEEELGGQLVRVYDLSLERVRLDSTTASGYWGVTEDGLFQWGHSKNGRPDLAQVKIMLATLDPLSLTVATEVLSGERADDPLYVPAITRVRETLLTRGLLYIGDCKMAAIATRAELAVGKDYYLCPLPAKRGQLESYLESVWAGTQELASVEYIYANGETKKIAIGYERVTPHTTEVRGQEFTWTERQLVVRSLAAATAGEKSLRTRLDMAQKALTHLGQPRRGKKQLTQLEEWQEAVEGILRRERVQGLLRVDYQVTKVERHLRRYRERPAQLVVESSIKLSVTVDSEAVAHQQSMLGWRVYVTNQPQAELSLSQAVVAYREEYLIERGFGRLKGFPLSLMPMYLLAAFSEITLLLIDVPHQTYVHLSPLSPWQQQILALLDFPLEIYLQLGPELDKPP